MPLLPLVVLGVEVACCHQPRLLPHQVPCWTHMQQLQVRLLQTPQPQPTRRSSQLLGGAALLLQAWQQHCSTLPGLRQLAACTPQAHCWTLQA